MKSPHHYFIYLDSLASAEKVQIQCNGGCTVPSLHKIWGQEDISHIHSFHASDPFQYLLPTGSQICEDRL